MSVKTDILLTFDYELFQGRHSGSVKNCMLLPTERILALLDKNKARAIFFVDMMYLCRLEEVATQNPQAQSDFALIETQIIEMANQGHYVFNHLHPHWLDAVYHPENNEWTLLDDSKYCFESLSAGEREHVFGITMALLNNILAKAKKKFKPDGYRAGGLYIQPVQSFLPQFKKHGINYEFSVLKNASGKLSNGKFSFSFPASLKNVYRFSNDINTEDTAGAYTEFAMKFASIPVHYRVMNSIFYRLFSHSKNHTRYGDGVSTSNPITIADKNQNTSNETFSVEMLNEVKLPLYIKEAKQYKYLHLLSHPKLISDYNLQVFDLLLQKLTATGNAEFDFKKFAK